jgi:hypothetical protein
MRCVNVHYQTASGVAIAAFCTEKAALAYVKELGSAAIKREIRGHIIWFAHR